METERVTRNYYTTLAVSSIQLGVDIELLQKLMSMCTKEFNNAIEDYQLEHIKDKLKALRARLNHRASSRKLRRRRNSEIAELRRLKTDLEQQIKDLQEVVDETQ